MNSATRQKVYRKIFKDEGVKYVSELGRRAAAGESVEIRPVLPEEDVKPTAPKEDARDDDVLELGLDAQIGKSIPADLRRQLTHLLARLEKAQDALDEATLALEAIDTADEQSKA